MNRQVESVRFVSSVAELSQRPKQKLPEIAFAGRSNVGKSSLLNRLVGIKNLARISRTPGKTRLLNYYLIDHYDFTAYFVDLPGFGYAKVSKRQRRSWGRLIEEYIETSKELRAVVHLIDVRHPPQDSDVQLSEWLDSIDRRSIRVLTKCDKIKHGQLARAVTEARRVLSIAEDWPVIPFSATDGMGRRELWREIRDTLETR